MNKTAFALHEIRRTSVLLCFIQELKLEEGRVREGRKAGIKIVHLPSSSPEQGM